MTPSRAYPQHVQRAKQPRHHQARRRRRQRQRARWRPAQQRAQHALEALEQAVQE